MSTAERQHVAQAEAEEGQAVSRRYRLIEGPSAHCGYAGVRCEVQGWFGWRLVDWHPSEALAHEALDRLIGVGPPPSPYGHVLREETVT